MLTAKQHELIVFIHDRLAETGVSPSFEEMKDALDLKSKSGVHRLISALEERAFIRRLPNRARAPEVLRMPDRPPPHRKGVARLVPKAAIARPMPEPATAAPQTPLHRRAASSTPASHSAGALTLPVTPAP